MNSVTQAVVIQALRVMIPPMAKILVGGVHFETIKRIAREVEQGELKGEAKKQAVLEELKLYGYKAVKLLVNAAIELAVIWINIELGQLKLGRVDA